MPSYEDRSRLIKQLSEQAYFDALKREDAQKKDVRVGGIDGRTGRYQVLSADGGLSSNGVSTSNAAPPSDGFVRGLQSPNVNAISLGWRKYNAVDFVAQLEEEEAVVIERIAILKILDFLLFSGNSVSGQPDSQIRFSTAFADLQVYTFNDFEFVEASTFNDASVTLLSSDDSNIDPELSSYITAFDEEERFLAVTLNLNAPFIALPPTPPYALLINYQIQLRPFDEWEDYILDLVGESQEDLITNGSVTYTWNTCPIELEAIAQGIPWGGNPEAEIRIFYNPVLQNIGFTVDLASPIIQPFVVGLTEYTFTFRWRKRGNTEWFSL